MINPREVPVFVITGFLESGKTTFITNAILSDPKLQSERVLIVACEEGETEYALYKNAYIHYIEEKEEMQEFIFLELCEKYNPTYVIIEYNAIWGMQVLYNAVMPDSWRFAQQATIIDGQTFEAYSSNMKNIFADMVRGSSMVVVNRCTREDDFKLYKDSIKRSAPRAEIVYMSDEEGILDILLEDDIPYDLSGDVITVNKENYLTWYVDTIDNPERYLGKTVDYIGIALKPAQFRDGYFTVGNEVMTCCEDDMQFLGFVCRYEKAELVREGNTVRIQAEIHYEYAPEYEGEGPVLYVKKATSMTKPPQKKKKKK